MTATVIEPLGTAATVPSAAPLHYLSCRWCGSAAEAGRLLCPVCGASGLVRQISAGVGTVRRLLGAIGGRDTHTQRCTVAMDEGFVARGTVVDVLPGEIAVGSRVRVLVSEPGTTYFAVRD
ncbi:PhlB family protein [Phaeacidiphilus oryzae]|uniref:hypothetical protein n=1 Tax=Phaeacidiphilus oryzae TaxID=348818 RepID=UPI00068A332F|nr:hypothetical protein [Phaeacidiphilus oryzae]